jgi:membrane protease YdiL (CAAX protease family)
VSSAVDTELPPARPRHGLELLAVLGVTYGISGINALLSFIRAQVTINHGVGFSNVATAPIQHAEKTPYQWLDILDQLASILSGVLLAYLAIVLLMRSPGGRGLGIGLDRVRLRELAQGAGFAALIGVPGLGFVYVARKLGANAQIVVTDFPDVWYRVPTLILEAFQQGFAEEIIVGAYVLTRLRQLGWTNSRALAAGAVLRGSYHLYQGYGGFVGNAVMGLIFGWWFQRTRRVWPLIIAHFVIDAVSFVGYVYLHGRVDWI